MVALASGFARSPRALAGVRIRDRRLRPSVRSRLRPIVLRRVCARTPKTRLPGVAPRLRRRATRRLRRLSLPSSPPAVCTPVWTSAASDASDASDASASPDADAVAFAPASSEEASGRVASRPGFPFQSPLAALAPISTAIPRASARFARCAVLARRFAALTAACLSAAVANCADAPVVPPLSPQRVGAMRPARFGAAARPLTRRGGSPPVPVPEPQSPSLISSARAYLTAQGRLRSHTPRSGLPRPPPPTFDYARVAFQLPSGTSEHSRFRSMACRKKFRQSDRTARTDLTERASR